jgi:transposase
MRRSAAEAAGQVARRQRVRLRPLPPGLPQAGHRPAHRATRVESSERLGRHRWVIERTLAWFARFRRLIVRHERRADVLDGFHRLAAALICLGFVERWSC